MTAPALPASIDDTVLYLYAGEGMFDATSGGAAVTTTGGLVRRWENQAAASGHATKQSGTDDVEYDAERNMVVFPQCKSCILEGTLSAALEAGANTVAIIMERGPARRGFRSGTGVIGHAAGYQFGVMFLGTNTWSLQGKGDAVGAGCLFVNNGTEQSSLMLPSSRSTVIQTCRADGVYAQIDETREGPWVDAAIGDQSAYSIGFSTTAYPFQGAVRAVVAWNRELSFDEISDWLEFAESEGCVFDSDDQVIADGDSITACAFATRNGGHIELITRDRPWRTWNAAEAGIELSSIVSQAANRIYPIFESGKRYAIFLAAGHNDLAYTGLTGAQIITHWETYGDAVKAAATSAGAEAIVIVPTIFAGTDITGGEDTHRTTANAHALTECNVATDYAHVYAAAPGVTWCDFVIDFDALTLDLPSDGVHPDQDDFNVMAPVAEDALRAAGFIVPGLSVTRSATPVTNGGTDPVGTVTQGATVTRTYTLTNSGLDPLTFGTVAVDSGLTITDNPSSATVSVGGTDTLTVSVSTSAPGAFSRTVTIPSDDPASPYTFEVTGTVHVPPSIPTPNRVFNIGADGGPSASNTIDASLVDDEVYGVNLSVRLPTGETVTSATVAIVKPEDTDVDIDSVYPIEDEMVDALGITAPVGRGVVFRASGFDVTGNHTLRVTTVCSDERTRGFLCTIRVKG